MIGSPDDRDVCAGCGMVLPKRSPTSPDERRCQDCWHAYQHSLPVTERHRAYRDLRDRRRNVPPR